MVDLATDIDFPIVDAHVHLWDPKRFRYSWLEQFPELDAPRLLQDFDQATRGLEIDALVVIQAGVDPLQAADESAWVVSLAERDPRVAAMIAWAPVENGASVRRELDRLTVSRRVTGVRRIIQFEDDPSFCVRTPFIEGVSCLADYGLCFDICVGQRQLPAALKLAASCPRVPLVLDHAGKPDIRSGELANWRSMIRRFGELPHVFCKLSGLIAQADPRAWTSSQLAPYIEAVIDAFGFERVMFGSDWPVSSRAAGYLDWVAVLMRVLHGTPADDLRRLFRDTATTFYRLQAVS